MVIRRGENVLLPKLHTGLPKESVANISQIVTIDKYFLSEKVGILSEKLVKQVEDGVRLILCL